MRRPQTRTDVMRLTLCFGQAVPAMTRGYAPDHRQEGSTGSSQGFGWVCSGLVEKRD